MSEMHWPEITKDTPLTEVKRIHQAIWNYVIEHGEKPDTPYHGDCVGCEYEFLYPRSIDTLCKICPIYWPKTADGTRSCIGDCNSGLYDRFMNGGDFERLEVAKQIRDLPFKYELEEKQNV